MEYRIRPASKFRGRWRAAGDKSLTHRAFILNAMAEGVGAVRNANGGEDCARTRDILQALGARIEQPEKGVWRVEGRGGTFRAPEEVLDAGNSGTTMRLLAGLLAGQPFTAVLDGDDSLRNRPMERIKAPLEALGAAVETGAGGRPPLTVRGAPLVGCRYVSPVASAQVKSAFLLAALGAEGESAFREPRRSRDHSERMLDRMGAELSEDEEGWICLTGPCALRAVDVNVPGDISSAAFLIAAGILVEKGNVLVKGLGVNPTRTGLLAVLERMGGRFALYHPREEAGEPVADLLAQYSRLQATEIRPEEVPSLVDEIPVLAVLAACANGESRFHGLAELRVKESDRLERTAALLTAYGADADVEGDTLRIRGGRPLRGTEFSSGGDHRLGMAATVAALVAQGESRVTDTGCIATSFPEFASLVRRFSAGALETIGEGQ